MNFKMQNECFSWEKYLRGLKIHEVYKAQFANFIE